MTKLGDGPRSARGRAPTLKDVAAAAKVSLATAARVLRNDTYHVDETLAKRVRAAAERLGYVPNVLARNLRLGSPTMVGLIVGDMIEPYYSEIAEAVTQHAEAAHGVLAIVCNMQRNPLLELKYCQQLWENRVAGLILSGGGFDQLSNRSELSTLLDRMARSGVVVTSLTPRGFSLPEFCADNIEVGRLMAGALNDYGHVEIGVIAGPSRSTATQLRLKGVDEVLKQRGIDCNITYSELSPEAGEIAARNLLECHPRITGLIVGSDTIAIGVLRSLRQQGRVVPRDASVVSVGNTHLAAMAVPKLTTVDVRLADFGRSALDFIVHKVKGHKPLERPSFPLRINYAATLAGPRS